MRRSALLASLVVGWAWVPPSHHHRTPHAVRKPLKAENDYLASLAKAPPKRGPGRLRRAWRRLRGGAGRGGVLNCSLGFCALGMPHGTALAALARPHARQVTRAGCGTHLRALVCGRSPRLLARTGDR